MRYLDYSGLSRLVTKIKAMVFQGSTSSADGENGLVPAPSAGDEYRFLRCDGTWTDISRGRISGSTVGEGSFAFGSDVTAEGNTSHAEGTHTIAYGVNSHAEGEYTQATGPNSHAEGDLTYAQAACTHAEGCESSASGQYSHAEGYGTTADRKSQHVSGEYNVRDSSGTPFSRGAYAEIVGNGTASNARSNARALDWSGNERLNGTLYVGCNADSTGGTEVATKDDIPGTVSKTYDGLCPALPNETTTTKYLRQDGTWQVPPNTTYSNVTKTSAGLCPALPNETTTTKYLRQDGTWQVPPDTNTWRPLADILKAVYPVGSIYISTSATNPATTFGFGTWASIGVGRTIVCAGTGYAAAGTGGSTTTSYTPAGTVGNHTLTTSQIASHSHGVYRIRSAAGGSAEFTVSGASVSGAATIASNTAGGGGAHNHGFTGTAANISTMQPWFGAYIWRRTA